MALANARLSISNVVHALSGSSSSSPSSPSDPTTEQGSIAAPTPHASTQALMIPAFSRSSSNSSSGSSLRSCISTAPTSPCSSPSPSFLSSKHASSSHVDSLPSPLHFSKHIWYPDGSILLLAHHTLFKLYSGLLAARSSVFSDMLSFPPPTEGEELEYEGKPVVRIYDDPQDVEVFLRALTDPSFYEPPPSPTTLLLTTSILRLSLKYDVPFLRRRALAHLHSTFPTSLSSWRQRESQRTIPGVDNTPFKALQVAREFGLDWMVPSLMYCIASHPIGKTLDGVRWDPAPRRNRSSSSSDSNSSSSAEGSEDDETAESSDEEEYPTDAEQIHLSWADKRAALTGRALLLQVQNRAALAFSSPPHSLLPSPSPSQEEADPSTPTNPCTSPVACASARHHLANLVISWGVAGLLDLGTEHSGSIGGLCEFCKGVMEEQVKVAGEKLWEGLPEVFGVGTEEEEGGQGQRGPTWEKLERGRKRGFTLSA
ncbi:hypothetical protein BDQ12DRAFT_472799 [Crucibulum laeve]|uniref:BTB domain-containing protein n=1 Tax=Crucibulum laeve TaxID=68775 RepID=A0A5C3LJE6_9AGAR|nr:hypothetical protein BDQ12DRAFT_472799 [Crucibulum laeve]